MTTGAGGCAAVIAQTGTKSQSLLEPLAWDSAHFGFPVARVTEPELDDARLEETLRRARRESIRLVYWPSCRDREAPARLLREFHGLLADRKATYLIDNLTSDADADADAGAETGPIRVLESPRGPASPRLVELAVAAGAFSRFRVDPSIPAERFERLYEAWIERSTRGELADVVLIAVPADSDAGADPLGMVTVSVAEGAGSVGLIAVDERARGRGVGLLLMRAAHRWMQGRGAARAAVVTQLDNEPAVRLYERSGYHLADVKNFYHFWPLEPVSAHG